MIHNGRDVFCRQSLKNISIFSDYVNYSENIFENILTHTFSAGMMHVISESAEGEKYLSCGYQRERAAGERPV